MKRIFSIALILSVIMVLALSVPVFAADPTQVDVNWSGSGSVGGVVAAGDDSVVSWGASGAGVSGTFTSTDSNNNPYGYGVDSVSSYMVSAVTDGSSFYQVERTDAKTSSYGPAGQMLFSFIGATGGSAEMAMGDSTNYAAMVSATYAKPKTSSGKNFEADASSFMLQQWVGNGNPGTPTGNWAGFTSTGSGTALIDCMSSEARFGTTILGDGAGCYTNADALLNGVGTFRVDAEGSNGITTPSDSGWFIPGDGSFGSTSFSVVANYAGSMSVADYSVRVQ